MRPAPRHIIQRHTVWLDSPRSSALGLQNRVSAYCRGQLPALLETLFDRLTDADVTLRLDTLTLDVGTLWPTRLEEQLTERITEQVEQALRQAMRGATGTVNNVAEVGPFGADRSVTLGRVERLSRAERLAQLLRYFLRNGHLPTWANADEFAQAGAWLPTAEAATFRRELRAWLVREPNLTPRLITHISPETLRVLAFGRADTPSVMTIERLLMAAHWLTQQSLPTLRARFWQSTFRYETPDPLTLTDALSAFAAALRPGQPPANFLRQLLAVLVETRATSSPIEAAPSATSANDALVHTLTRLIDTTFGQTLPADGQSPRVGAVNLPKQTAGQEKVIDKDATLPGSDEPARNAPTDNITAAAKPDVVGPDANRADTLVMLAAGVMRNETPGRVQSSDRAEELFVPLAGVVLLHPFLQTLFTEMSLLTTKQHWKSEAAALKGVQVLAYLATGQDHCPEYDMLLPKLLCGLPFETVVSPNLDLTDTDRANATEVLNAVIEHWTALGNVSTDGLREAFLQRDGKLAPADTGWQLTVERKTLDILLDRLPWGVSTIKLPFMADLLFVDWT